MTSTINKTKIIERFHLDIVFTSTSTSVFANKSIVLLEFTSEFQLFSVRVRDFLTSVFFFQSEFEFVLFPYNRFLPVFAAQKMLRISSPPTPTVGSQLPTNTNMNACKRGCTYFSHTPPLTSHPSKVIRFPAGQLS